MAQLEKLRIGNKEVQMIHTSNQRKLQYAGTKIGLAISALWYLGRNLVNSFGDFYIEIVSQY